MSVQIKVKLKSNLANKLEDMSDDEVLGLQIHNLFAKIIDPYVPMDEGVLAQSVEVFPDHIRYPGPYAHYQYVGEVYGPNIPIIEDGVIVGWFSPPGMKKHPTGSALNYSKDKHPLATKEWDKVAMQTHKKSFEKQVKELIIRRLNENG